MKIKLSQRQLERIESDRWLTDRERKVFELYYRRGWSIEEIAAEIDRNRSTVNRILCDLRIKTK